MTISPDGKLIAVANSVYDVASGKVVADITAPERDKDVAQIRQCRFSPDGKWFASSCRDGFAFLWDTSTWKVKHRWRKTTAGKIQPENEDVEFNIELESLAFSPDSRTLVVCARAEVAYIWDVATGKEVKTLKADFEDKHVFQITGDACEFSPDGKTFAATCYAQIVLFDTTTWEYRAALSSLTDNYTQLKFTPDGKRMVTFDEGRVLRFWDRDGNTFLHKDAYARQPGFSDISPSGKALLSSFSTSFRVVDISAPGLTQIISESRKEPDKRVLYARYMPNGSLAIIDDLRIRFVEVDNAK